MQKIINIAKNHKRTIATIAGPVLTWAIAKGWIDADTATMLATLLTVFSGVAVSHAAIKARKPKPSEVMKRRPSSKPAQMG